MKIAILISGEYRTFKHCRKSMTFLDDPRVNVYFSTWNKTVYSCPKIDLLVTHNVDEQQIIDDHGRRPAGIIIDDIDRFYEDKYNSKMIDRWITGFRMITDSGIDYDYVIITRPDMYYSDDLNLDKVIEHNDSLGVIWSHSLDEGKLSDIILVSSFRLMKDIIGPLTVQNWAMTDENDWHKWWYEYCISKTAIKELDYTYGKCTFYRCLVPNGTSDYQRIFTGQHDWRDLRLLYDSDIYGRIFSLQHWPKKVVEEAERKWSEGYYDKYKNYGKDNP